MSEQQHLDEARELLRTGWYVKAIARLEGCEDWRPPLNAHGSIVRAEALLRADPVDALESLARVSDLFTAPESRFAYYVTSGRAYANSRNFVAAREMFALAEPFAHTRPHGDAELAHHRARLKYLEGIFEPEDPDIALALGNADAGARVNTLVVRAWMHAGLGHYDAQIADLRHALALARDHADACDVYTVARGIYSLLRAACELGDAEASDEAQAAYDRLEWTPELADMQFQCVRTHAWDAFLRGDSARAQWLFRDSKAMAPNDAWRVWAHVDRAYVARMNGNEAWAIEELAQAEELARAVVWSQTVDEERIVLVTLAALLASSDRARAQRYVSIYVRLGTQNVDPSLAIAHDPRVEGFQQYALGRVHEVLGNAEAASAAYEAAYGIFARAQHHFRAALAALGLSEVTASPEWIERARDHAAHYPNSAFNAYLSRSIERPEAGWNGALTPFQRQLALALCTGLEMPALSQRFSRSENTMRREVRSLYDHLAVRSRRQLRDLLEAKGAV